MKNNYLSNEEYLIHKKNEKTLIQKNIEMKNNEINDTKLKENKIIEININEEIEWIFPENWKLQTSPRISKDQNISYSSYLTNPNQERNEYINKKIYEIRSLKTKSYKLLNQNNVRINDDKIVENFYLNDKNNNFENMKKRNSFKIDNLKDKLNLKILENDLLIQKKNLKKEKLNFLSSFQKNSSQDSNSQTKKNSKEKINQKKIDLMDNLNKINLNMNSFIDDLFFNASESNNDIIKKN
jgi:hypothetical protein